DAMTLSYESMCGIVPHEPSVKGSLETATSSPTSASEHPNDAGSVSAKSTESFRMFMVSLPDCWRPGGERALSARHVPRLHVRIEAPRRPEGVSGAWVSHAQGAQGMCEARLI